MKKELPSALLSDIELSLQTEESPSQVTPISAVVSMSMSESAIPFGLLKHTEILPNMFNAFRSTFDRKGLSLPGQNVEDMQIIASRVDAGEMLLFEGGYTEFEEGETVPIMKIGIGKQTILAHVWGTSRQAIYICKKIGEMLWESVGRSRRWSEISDQVYLVSYNTNTQVKLGVPLKGFFSDGIQKFLDQDITSGLGADMGKLGQLDPGEHQDFRIVTKCREIQFDVSLFNELSGAHELSVINIIPDTTFSGNSGDVKISSELPFDRHVELIEILMDRLR